MHWARRLLTDADDDTRFAWGLAVILGACFVGLPVLFGLMDLVTTLVVSLVGVIAVLPAWRHVGGPLSRPLPIIAFALLLVGIVLVRRDFPLIAYFTYFGAWAGTLGALRFVTDWRGDP